ncbi:molybdate ABC transporter substrate-binding protein [Pantoea sp. NPDC088449]|uniref:molybdate ABC transporter substrate-binding protein n=1 Tax=Pantoea sp. NPDC088449 TaxID=3364392 RepID=UPI003807C3D0
MTTLQILAAGSLRAVWPDLEKHFTSLTGLTVTTDFAPAGLLRQRIEAGEHCDFFASANMLHPQRLLAQGRACAVGIFAANALCLTVNRDVVTQGDDWLALLRRNDLRLATSTPHCDPSGDYTWQLFDNIERLHHGLGERIRRKARPLVGGAESLALPAGELAAQWLIEHHYADTFIGYVSYAPRLRRCTGLQVFDIPEPYNVQAEYGWACCSPAAQPFAQFIMSGMAQRILQQHGFQLAR